jgi:hypothetical protein
MHKKSFLIRDILTQMSSQDDASSLKVTDESMTVTSSRSFKDKLFTKSSNDSSRDPIDSIRSNIDLPTVSQCHSMPFLLNPPLLTSLFYPNVLPQLSYTWQSIAAAAIASESIKSPSFVSFANDSSPLNQLISNSSTVASSHSQLHFLCDLNSNTSLSDSDSGCSSPLSLCSPDSPESDEPITSGQCNTADIVSVTDDQSPHSSKVNRKSRKSKSDRSRRNRTVFTELQLMGLERRFDSQKYLSTPDRAELARALSLTQLQVKTWYQVSTSRYA